MATLRELLESEPQWPSGINYNKVESDKDTLLEFETQGIRPKFTIRQPLLYGTQTLRITRRSTGILDDMKENRTNLEGGEGGLLTSTISKAKETLNDWNSKILKIPTLQIPTRVSDSLEGTGNSSTIPETLAKIREDAAGSLVGKFLKQNAQGTPKQVGRQAIGGAIGVAKNELRGAVFGVGGEPNLSPSAEDTINKKPSLEDLTYHNLKLYSKTIKVPGFDEFGLRFNLGAIQDGTSWTKSFVDDKVRTSTTSYADPSKQYFPQFSVESITQNIPGKRDKTNKYTDRGGIFNSVEIINETSDGSDGKFRTKSDTINLSDLYTDENDTSLDNYDFLPLRFYSVAKQQGVAFKATVNGISENFSPSWEGSNFIGNPYTFYTYQTMDRDLTFSFSVYALSAEEHKKNWEKLDFLTSLVYPQNTRNDVYVTPPLLKVTLGNMYKNKLGFIESLSYTIDDNTPWEIGLGAEKTGNRISNVKVDNELKNYKLPTIINVAVSYQIIETSSDVVGKKLYPYGTSMIYGEK
jgi:hypothetical protein